MQTEVDLWTCLFVLVRSLLFSSSCSYSNFAFSHVFASDLLPKKRKRKHFINCCSFLNLFSTFTLTFCLYSTSLTWVKSRRSKCFLKEKESKEIKKLLIELSLIILIFLILTCQLSLQVNQTLIKQPNSFFFFQKTHTDTFLCMQFFSLECVMQISTLFLKNTNFVLLLLRLLFSLLKQR